MIMANPRLWRWFGGPQGMMQMFGDGMTEQEQNDIFKIGASYTFDNDLTISPDLKYDFGADDITKYGLQIDKGEFSANLGYEDGFTGSLAYGPVQVGTTGDGARLDFNKNIKEFYDTEGRTTGGLDIKGFYDTEGNWNIGPTFSMSFGGPDKKSSYEGTSLAELQEALQKEKLYAKGGRASYTKGGLAKILGV